MKTPNKLLSALLSAGLFWGCNQQQKTEDTEIMETEVIAEDIEPTLTLLWETAAELITCESVLYDDASGTIYVANIEGNPSEKDGKGFISIISKSGEILERDWITGLDAPKGMGISNGKLYVTNVDEVVEIDIESASISKKYPVPGAQFLNDLDSDGDKIYFSDMGAGKIYILQKDTISTFAENQEKINGLRIAEDGTLYGLDGEGLKKYNADGTAEVINNQVTGGDGLIIPEADVYLASRWAGEIYLIQENQEKLLLDTKAAESNTADIGFIPDEQIVLVPTFMKNKVAAYQLNY